MPSVPKPSPAHSTRFSVAGFALDRVDDLLSAAWNRVVGADPGLLRLRFGLRVALSVAATTLALMALHSVLAWPIPVMAPGALVALFSSIAIRDRTIPEQRRSLWLAAVVTFVCYAGAALLADYPYVADVVFLAVVFVAVYARRFGMRWGGLGMIAYVAFFLGQFLHPGPAQLLLIPLPLAIGTLASYLVRFHVTHEEPRIVAVRIVAALELRIADLLAEVQAILRSGDLDERRRGRLALRVEALNEVAVMADLELDIVGRDDPDAEARPALRQRLLVLELAAERLAALTARAPHADAEMAGALAMEQARFRGAGSGRDPPAAPRARAGEGAAFARALDDLRNAHARFLRALAEPQREDRSVAAEPFRWAPPGGQSRGWIGPAFQQATQVTVACGLAMLGGEMISPHRWFWAVITAYVAFAGISSRGDSLMKIGARLVGTVAGVAIGIGLGLLLREHPYASLALVFLAMFIGFYYLFHSYWIAVFWITVYVSLAYVALGYFSVDLLELRVMETLVGTVAAAIAALVVFPRGTRAVFAERARGFLQALAHVTRDSVAAMTGEDSPAAAPDALRDLDRSFHMLRDVARPLTWRDRFARGATRRIVALLRAANYWARELSALAQHEPFTDDEAHALRRRGARIERIVAQLLAIIGAGAGAQQPDARAGDGEDDTPLPDAADQAFADRAFALANLERVLRSLVSVTATL